MNVYGKQHNFGSESSGINASKRTTIVRAAAECDYRNNRQSHFPIMNSIHAYLSE